MPPMMFKGMWHSFSNVLQLLSGVCVSKDLLTLPWVEEPFCLFKIWGTGNENHFMPNLDKNEIISPEYYTYIISGKETPHILGLYLNKMESIQFP